MSDVVYIAVSTSKNVSKYNACLYTLRIRIKSSLYFEIDTLNQETWRHFILADLTRTRTYFQFFKLLWRYYDYVDELEIKVSNAVLLYYI